MCTMKTGAVFILIYIQEYVVAKYLQPSQIAHFVYQETRN